MSKAEKPLKNFWDKTTQTDNKLTISNRFCKVLERVREDHNVSEGKAIEGLASGKFSFEETLKQLKKEYHDIS